MHPFCTPWKHQKTVMFSGVEKGCIGNEWVKYYKLTLLLLKARSSVWDNFWQLKALKKWWKMFFIYFKKLFSFGRYLNFCSDFFVHVGKRLVKKAKVNFQNLWQDSLKSKHSNTILPNISRSKSNQTIKFGQLLEDTMRNDFLEESYTKSDGETGVVPDRFLNNQNWGYLCIQ